MSVKNQHCEGNQCSRLKLQPWLGLLLAAAQSHIWIYIADKKRNANQRVVRNLTKFQMSKNPTHRIPVRGVSIREVEALARAAPQDLPIGGLEHLVRVPGGTRPDLELHAVLGGPVRHVETLVVEGRDRAREGRHGDQPGNVAILRFVSGVEQRKYICTGKGGTYGEEGVEVLILARNDGNLGAIRVGRGGDAVRAEATAGVNCVRYSAASL